MSALADRAVTDVRKIHLEMIDAVLAGGGVAPVATIAAEHLGGPVDGRAGRRRRRRAGLEPRRRGPGALRRRAPRARGAARRRTRTTRTRSSSSAAIAVLTAVTLRDANVTQRRATAAVPRRAAPRRRRGRRRRRRARRLGADLSPRRQRAQRPAGTPSASWPRSRRSSRARWRRRAATASRRCCRAPSGDAAAARGSPRRLGTTGLSPFEPDAAALGGALRVAELSVRARRRRARRRCSAGAGGCCWRAERRERQALIDSTVGPAGELIETVRAYLAHGANMNATAVAVYRAPPHRREPPRARARADRSRPADAARAGSARTRCSGARYSARGDRTVRR